MITSTRIRRTHNVRQMILPLWAAGDSSAVQDGAMTIRKDTPIPATIRAHNMRARFVEAAWRITPAMHQKDAIHKPFIPVAPLVSQREVACEAVVVLASVAVSKLAGPESAQ